MSDLSRREFLKSLSIGGVALFTPEWFKLVADTKLATQGRELPARAGEKIKPGWNVINAFWTDNGYFELCLNGTIYDEVPEFEYEEEEFDEDNFRRYKNETDDEYEERREEAREEWEQEQEDERETLEHNHEDDWYRHSCPGARAVPYLQEVLDLLEERSTTSEGSDEDYEEVGAIEFYDGACPGNDTYVAATAPDYETLAALQRALHVLRKRCRVVIVEPDVKDAKQM